MSSYNAPDDRYLRYLGRFRMANILEKALLMGLGVFTLTREKVSEAVNELVEEEGVEPEEAQKLTDALMAKGESEREALRDMVRQEVSRVKPVTRQEFEALKQEVTDLADKIDQLSDSE
jgi:polyhydroxyalkanoate synthesis regulator phasin